MNPKLEAAWRATRDFVHRRKRDYVFTFRTEAGKRVLQDLAKFCRANETTFRADPREHAVLEGRREVFLRIANHMNLSTEQLYAIQGGIQVDLGEDETQ